MNKTILAVIPHADDAAAMCGGTLAKFADQGWKVVIARVTNDDKDSMRLPTREDTERVNTEQFKQAAHILGASETVDLGFVTDVLADTPLTQIRERIIYLFRKYRPFAVISFDPFAPFEPNQDHVRVAQAVEESYWVSNFHLHHPEHFMDGLKPHAVCERWYYARTPFHANHVEDITETIQRKVDALCAHDEMLRNTLHQLQLQLRTWGRYVPAIDESIQGDFKPLVSDLVRSDALATAREFGLPEGRLAEVFRLNRFGSYEGFVQANSAALPGEPDEMFTRPCFDPDIAPPLHN
jgi:LmbE family N-acetylglucosaminyl deacetylase